MVGDQMERRDQKEPSCGKRFDDYLKWVFWMAMLSPALGFLGGIFAIAAGGPEVVVVISSVTTINVMIAVGTYKMRKELKGIDSPGN